MFIGVSQYLFCRPAPTRRGCGHQVHAQRVCRDSCRRRVSAFSESGWRRHVTWDRQHLYDGAMTPRPVTSDPSAQFVSRGVFVLWEFVWRKHLTLDLHGGVYVVCQRVLSLWYNGRCSLCFHVAVTPLCPATTERPLVEEAPMSGMFSPANEEPGPVWRQRLVEVSKHAPGWHRRTQRPTRLHRCHRALVLAAARGGRRHANRQENDTKRRCPPGRRSARVSPPVDTHDARLDAVVTRFCSAVHVRLSCRSHPYLPRTALSLFCARFIQHTAAEVSSLGHLRRVAPRPDQVRKAHASFPSVSGATPSGLRSSHVLGALLPAITDLLLPLLSEGRCGATLRLCAIMASRKPNGTLRR